MDVADFKSLATYVTFMQEDIAREVGIDHSGQLKGNRSEDTRAG
jgi:hypothetical protein